MMTLLICTLACIMMSGCMMSAPNRILVSQDYVGERSVQYLMQKTGKTTGKEEDKVELFNFYARICTITENGKESDCKDTLILRNVQSKPVY